MRLVFLTDNNAVDSSFESEHGLSVYLEKDKQTFLFDTGASDVFIRNAYKLNIDLAAVDYLFISHAHYDHIGGLQAFLDINHHAKIIISKYALNRKLFSKRTTLREIGNSYTYENLKDRILFVEDEVLQTDGFIAMHIDSNLYPTPKANYTLYKEVNGELIQDDFDHEIVVVIGDDNHFVYTGCAHHGLLNMLAEVQKYSNKPIRQVVGGFHLVNDYETDNEIKKIASILKTNYPDSFFMSGHCTGSRAIQILKQSLGSQFQAFLAGYSIKI